MSAAQSSATVLPPPGARVPNGRDRQLLEMPALTDKLPLRFDNGFTIDGFGGICSECEGMIPLESTFGSITRPTPRMVVIEAIGVCRCCRRGTPFLLRMKDDGQYTTLIGDQWRAGTVQMTWKGRFMRWWRRLATSA